MDSTHHASAPAYVTCVDDIPLIAVSGRLDTISSSAFDAQIAPVLDNRFVRVLLDMSAVTYVSSAGLRSILKIIKHASGCGGRVGMFSVPAPILEILEISGFQTLLDIYPDRETALKESVAR